MTKRVQDFLVRVFYFPSKKFLRVSLTYTAKNT